MKDVLERYRAMVETPSVFAVDPSALLRDMAAEIERLRPPLRELYEWYDRDGSVGAAADVFEKHRALLAQLIEHEPSDRALSSTAGQECETLPSHGALLAEINKAAHANGTNAWVRDVLQRAHRAIRKSAPPVAEPIVAEKQDNGAKP